MSEISSRVFELRFNIRLKMLVKMFQEVSSRSEKPGGSENQPWFHESGTSGTGLCSRSGEPGGTGNRPRFQNLGTRWNREPA